MATTGVAGSVLAGPQHFKIGWASADITPAGPVQLFGQYEERISTGVRDPLSATAMALESGSGDVQAVLVSVDLLEGGYNLQKDLRALLSNRLPGFNLTNLILNATHDHCAPYPFTPPDRSAPEGLITGDEWRTNTLLPRLADAVVEAWSNRVPAAVSFQSGAAAIGFCRVCTYDDGSARMYGDPLSDPGFKEMESGNDHAVGLLYVFSTDGTLMGVVINIASPPQEVQGDTRITGSIWGEVRNQLQVAYPGIRVLPQCGAAGCQAPWDLTAGDFVSDDYDRMIAHATLIADLVQTNYPAASAGRLASLRLDHQVREYSLPQKAAYGGTYPWELHVLRLGDTAIANNPFELYLDYGFAIKALSTASHTLLVQLSGNADDPHLTQYEHPEFYLGYHIGYLPTARAVAGGAYGAQDENGGVGPEGGAELVAQTASLINSLFDGTTNTMVDETNSAILYAGSGWNSYREPGLYNLNGELSADEGDSVEFTFTGTSIKWYDTADSDRGRAEVYLDGHLQATVDGYSPITLYQHEMFRAMNLGAGPHTIQIVNTGEKNDDSSDDFVGLDYFVVGTCATGDTVSAPTFSPAAGTYHDTLFATIACSTPGATLRYTTDGSTPAATNGTIYSSPIPINSNTTLKAIACETGLNDSSITSGSYVLVAGAPTFNPAAGSYTNDQTVTLSSVTPGAVIRYTVDGTLPTSTSGALYCSPLAISTNTTLQAIATRTNLPDSPVTSGVYSIVTLAPAFNPSPGTYTNARSVTITSATAGASIRYSLDGTTPTSNSGKLYTNAVSIGTNATLKAIAYKSGLTDSLASSGKYVIRVAAPVLSPVGGTYPEAQSVTVSTTTAGASIRYTTDGTTPSPGGGTVYAGPISIGTNTTLKVIAYAAGMSNSPVTAGDYFIQVAAPVLSPVGGTYPEAQSVTVSTTTAGASMRYTTDGTTPSPGGGTVYTGPISIGTNTTLKVIAYAAGMSNSPVTAGDYFIQVAAPGFSLSPGSYLCAQSVEITTSTAGASIRYSLDGSLPSSTNGTLYAGAIAVTNSTLIQAVACKAGMEDSPFSSGAFFILPTLQATISDGFLIITWNPPGGTLQAAGQLTAQADAWYDVNTNNPAQITIDPLTNLFYRVRQP
jgi:hypothetical protein